MFKSMYNHMSMSIFLIEYCSESKRKYPSIPNRQRNREGAYTST
jgi:hypothetical protein